MLRHASRGAAARAGWGIRHMSAVDPQSLRSMAVRGSPGVLVDPYVPNDELERPSPLSTDYWVNLWRDSRETIRSGLARGRMQRAISDFSPSAFPTEAEKIFRSVQDAYSIGDQSLLRPLVAEHMLSAVKRTMKARNFKANVRHAARVLNFEEPTKVVQYRQLLQTSSQADMFHAQVTVRFLARYAVGEYTKRGEYVRDATALPDDFDLSVVLPMLDKGTTCPWRVAKDGAGSPYYFHVETHEARWKPPRLYIDDPSIYAGKTVAEGGKEGEGGDDPLGMGAVRAPLSVVRETFAVFERPAFLPDSAWRIMVMYTPVSTAEGGMGSDAAGVIKGTQRS